MDPKSLSGTATIPVSVIVVLARGPGCPSRHEPARSQGFRIPADNFPTESHIVSDTIYSPLFSMHGLNKVAHVSHVPAWLAPIQPPFAALDGQLSPQSTTLSPLAQPP